MSKRDERIKELHDKHIAPVEAAAQRMFGSPDGQRVLDSLERMFAVSVAFTPGGGVDPYGTIVNAARAEVISYLRDLAEGTGRK